MNQLSGTEKVMWEWQNGRLANRPYTAHSKKVQATGNCDASAISSVNKESES
jgi:hypothetical protein